MNVYFSGIGGVGIGPLAQIALDAGYSVYGSDSTESPLTKKLAAQGAPVSLSQNGDFLRKINSESPLSWFVYTSALPQDHPELITARELGLKISKRDEFLSELIAQKGLKLIAVAGTHGKTTATGMFVWALKQLQTPASYSVGTTLSYGPSGLYDPQSEYFIYECDEFDKNFLNFHPFLSITTSFDYDHPDTYSTRPEYVEAFNKYSEQCQNSIIWKKDASSISETALSSTELLNDDEVLDIKIAGEHNRRNATLVVKALQKLEIATEEEAIQALNSFPGTDRRFERIAPGVYSDYGHHPIEIAATLSMAREISDKITVVYQPHQNRRQHMIKGEYTDQFEDANKIYWLDTYLTREDPSQEVLSAENLTQNITNKESVILANLNDDLAKMLKNDLADGYTVLFMGAGTIDKWARENLAELDVKSQG